MAPKLPLGSLRPDASPDLPHVAADAPLWAGMRVSPLLQEDGAPCLSYPVSCPSVPLEAGLRTHNPSQRDRVRGSAKECVSGVASWAMNA